MKILITGGFGFIGTAVVRKLLNSYKCEVLIIDKMGHAANVNSMETVFSNSRLQFLKADICNSEMIEELIFLKKPNKIIHLVAETHVDKSIDSSKEFLINNVMRNYSLGHDERYEVNIKKLKKDLGWSTKEMFNSVLVKTKKWY